MPHPLQPSKVYNLQAESEQDRAEWMDAITGVIAALLNAQAPRGQGGGAGGGAGRGDEGCATALNSNPKTLNSNPCTETRSPKTLKP